MTSDSGTRRACWFHHRPLRHLPVTEISAVPPDLEVESNDRLPSRNPPARNTATSLPEMPNSHDACAHLAGAYGIRTSHVRMLHMQPGRENRYSVRSNEVRRCWLARWRIAAADVRSWRRPTPPQSPIQSTRSRSFTNRGIHCRRDQGLGRRDQGLGPILISLSGGDPGMTRTCDLRFRKPSLYPAELRDREPALVSGCCDSISERRADRQPLKQASRQLNFLSNSNDERLCSIHRSREICSQLASEKHPVPG